VIRRWEEALEALDPNVGHAIVRIGLVLGKDGGAMVPLLRMTRWGLATIMGSGRQYFSFIHLSDLHRALDFILAGMLSGTINSTKSIFNLCSPFPVDNATFTKLLAELTGTKCIVRIPSFFLKTGLGEAHILITGGPKVLPARLSDEGFVFNYPSAEEALGKLVKDIEESH
jgi:NAD dependent epimerase/dehydratase family enzyme